MIVYIILLAAFSLGGWACAFWVNESWFKHSIKSADDWFDFCQQLRQSYEEIEQRKKGASE